MSEKHGPKKMTPKVASPASGQTVSRPREVVPPVQPNASARPTAVGAPSVKDYNLIPLGAIAFNGWGIHNSGGGVESFRLDVAENGGSFHCLLTAADDAALPETPDSQARVILYAPGGEALAQFTGVADLCAVKGHVAIGRLAWNIQEDGQPVDAGVVPYIINWLEAQEWEGLTSEPRPASAVFPGWKVFDAGTGPLDIMDSLRLFGSENAAGFYCEMTEADGCTIPLHAKSEATVDLHAPNDAPFLDVFFNGPADVCAEKGREALIALDRVLGAGGAVENLPEIAGLLRYLKAKGWTVADEQPVLKVAAAAPAPKLCEVDEVIALLGGFGKNGVNPNLDAFERISNFLHGLWQDRISLPKDRQAQLGALIGAEGVYEPKRGAVPDSVRFSVEEFYAAASECSAWGEDAVLTRTAHEARLEMAKFCGTTEDIEFWTDKMKRDVHQS